MLVPQNLHQIWLQGGELPEPLREYTTGVSYLSAKTGWQYSLWSAQDYKKLSSESQEIFRILSAKCCHISQQSNILRYLILKDFGGLYLDVDVRLQKLPEALDGAWAHKSFASACPAGHPWVLRIVSMLDGVDLSKHGTGGSRLVRLSMGPDVNMWPSDAWGRFGDTRVVLGTHGLLGVNMGSYKLPPVTVV
jgi:hypothetical protein